jgi:rhomboid protease GluP
MMVLMDSRRMCPHCRAFITTKDRVCPYCNEPVAPPAAQRDEGVRVLGGQIPHFRFNTSIILLINVGMYLATAMYSSQRRGNSQSFLSLDPYTLIYFGANWIGDRFIPGLHDGQWWRLVTAGFLHGGIIHIGMNCWVLFDLGAQVEEVYGAARMMVAYFVATVCGFYVSAFVGHQPLSVGASAGLMGLIGAMIAFGVQHRSGIGREIRTMYVRWAIYILAMGLVMRMTDNWAHVGGLAGGFAVAYVAGTPGRIGSPVEMVWRVASAIAILLTGLSFLKWYLWFASTTPIMG